MHVDLYEKWWIGLGVAMLLIFAGAIGTSGFAASIQVPQPEARIDPKTVTTEGPFVEPGLRELAPGKYEAYILAQASPWKFSPAEIRVPVGATVTFYITSADVQHGFDLYNTNINMMALPGQISKLTVTFDTPGEYPYVCHEYCGVGHQNMYGKIIVEP
ncbi:MAG: cytochrome c oxidase subunit II [Anaerolineae bacterium]|nr:cupredoxin domain-containing protein [Anaerolineales bacterium]MCQ3976412.1 cytochrome c oxidase subunit II [Anaerolineae bacterium]